MQPYTTWEKDVICNLVVAGIQSQQVKSGQASVMTNCISTASGQHEQQKTQNTLKMYSLHPEYAVNARSNRLVI